MQVLEVSSGGQLPSELEKEAWHPEEAAPDLRPGDPVRARAWQEGSWGTASRGSQGKQPPPHPPRPQRQLQKVGRAPASVRPGELPAPRQAGRSNGLGPHPLPGPQLTHRHTHSPARQPAFCSAERDNRVSPCNQGRCLWLAEGEAGEADWPPAPAWLRVSGLI